MARETEDLMGELYAWDTTIEDVFALSKNDPKRDEDDAVDAYEETIQLASRPDDGSSDAVLSLAAQMLAKHFFKFPHVHMNVVKVMLTLCKPERPQAVRINTIRSLMQIVKTPPSAAEPFASECADEIQSVIAKLVEKETSGVIMRHMSQLGKALKERKEAAAQAAAAEDKLAKKKNQKAEKLKKKAEKAAEKEKEREHKKKVVALAASAASASASAFRAAVDAAVAPVLSTNDRDKQRLRRVITSEDFDDRKGTREERRSNREDSGSSSKGDEKRKRIEELLARPPDLGIEAREECRSNREDSGSSSKSDEKRKRIEELLARPPDQPRSLSVSTPTGGSSCPPGPYIFIGNLPMELHPSEIVSFLSKVDPSMRNQHVQVKYPSRTSGYAFVSLRSTQLAREAIRFVNRVKFHGQMMKANFARGPPCQTLTFVERSGKNRSMEDDDAVRDFDFKKCDRNIWDRLCDALRTYGKLKVIETGKVRFDDVENAKEVIKKHHFNIQNYEIIPIYEPDDQMKHDATRSRPLPTTPLQHQQQSSGVRQSFSLKSGRVVGDQQMVEESELSKSERATEIRKSEKRDQKSDKIDERRNRKRNPSPLPVSKKRESSSTHDKSRSRSTSPSVLAKVKPHEARGRRSGSHSRSPVAKSRKQSARGRSQSRSVSPDAMPAAFRKQSESRKKKQQSASASRSRSPAARSDRKEKSRGRSRSRSVSPVPARKQETRRRSQSPPSPVPVQKKRDQDDEFPPMNKKNNGAPRSRSRSLLAVKERKSGPPPPTHRESPPPANQRQMHPNDAPARGGPSEKAQQPRRKSRSRSGERVRYVPKDMSTYGPAAGSRGDGGAKQSERERNLRENDEPSERSRQPQPERRDSGGGRGGKGGKMSRYGPASSDLPSDRANNDNKNGGGRDERRDDRQAPKRERRDSPQRPRTQSFGDNNGTNNNQEPPLRNEQRRRSRSPPRFGGERARSRSPHNRSRPVDAPPRMMPADNGGRGRDVSRPLERKNSGSRRGDDRSVAEVAREELEKQRQQQQLRRESYSTGNNLSRYGDGGRSEQFPTPPPQRDGGRPRGGSFQRPRSRSRSRSPPVRPTQQQQLQRQNDFSRDRVHSPLVPPHVRDFNRRPNAKGSPQFDQHQGRGNNNVRDVPLLDRKYSSNNMRDSPLLDRKHNINSMRDSPLLDQPKRDRRDSDVERVERRGRSPPPSPLMVANDYRGPAPPVVEQRNRSRSNTRGGRADDRDRNRKESRQSRRSEKRKERALNDQNNRNRANDQGRDRSKGRQERPLSPVLASPPSGKRLRSLTPSPVRRDTGSNNSNQRTKSNKTTASRERSRSPILKRPVQSGAVDESKDRSPAEKKRRTDDDDDFLPKPASAAVFDDMDEMMVDYEEDDD